MFSNCWPWQFYGRFSAFCPFHRGWNVLKLPTLAVLWPLFSPVTGNCRPWQFYGRFSALTSLSSSNCRPWQFYGRFSALTKSGHETADLGSFMATVMKLQTLAVLWPVFSLDKKLLLNSPLCKQYQVSDHFIDFNITHRYYANIKFWLWGTLEIPLGSPHWQLARGIGKRLFVKLSPSLTSSPSWAE